MGAVRARPVLRGQCFANKQILRGPVLEARKGPMQACLQRCVASFESCVC